ncbi:hypothetical protein H072_6062 [Dactylellina haptotyla CBS 200.50]|uniref:Nucleoside phosphorylase domain-containing protein n=1 Tax=Dactylellina haptotyla (strain CBS 200.50) TaxID=1284197 RepID=S8BXR9_DACHA|nr:hypothetical protein H072_6062 [Dactylellina haptotyla CBS 200.50]
MSPDDYTVGWVCALDIELAPAQEMLDEEHEKLRRTTHDQNIYTLGRIGKHNVVIATLPSGKTGIGAAAVVTSRMRQTFRFIEFWLLVGIGGGVPSRKADIRLGDVAVSRPEGIHPGVVQWDFGKTNPNGFERTGALNNPSLILLSGLTHIRSRYDRGGSKLMEYVANFPGPKYTRPDTEDILFKSEYNHVGEIGSECTECDQQNRVNRRRRRTNEAAVHYGTIASGNEVVKSPVLRDAISASLGNVVCIEMEAAGLMNDFPCLVIRGISDYADSHKNDDWQRYAALTAAAYAKDLLTEITLPETLKPVLKSEPKPKPKPVTTASSSGFSPYSRALPVGTMDIMQMTAGTPATAAVIWVIRQGIAPVDPAIPALDVENVVIGQKRAG